MMKTAIFVVISFTSLLINLSFGAENKTKHKIGVSDVGEIRCLDKDLQRTLTWNTSIINHSLDLLHYRVQFCPVAYCGSSKDYTTVLCFKDESRTKIIKRLRTNRCIASVLQLDSWPYYHFRVTGVYTDQQRNITVKKRWAGNCNPIEQSTTLSPLNTLVFAKETSLNIHVEFEKNFENTLSSLMAAGSTIQITYYYCLNELRGKKIANDYIDRCRKELNPDVVYIDLQPGVEYEVITWYNISSDFSVKSQTAKRTVRTISDPFPVRAQIATIVSSASFILLLIFITLMTKFIWNRWRNMSELTRRKLPPIVEELIYSLQCMKETDGISNSKILLKFFVSSQPEEEYRDEEIEIIQFMKPLKKLVITGSQNEEDNCPPQMPGADPSTVSVQTCILHLSLKTEINSHSEEAMKSERGDNTSIDVEGQSPVNTIGHDYNFEENIQSISNEGQELTNTYENSTKPTITHEQMEIGAYMVQSRYSELGYSNGSFSDYEC
uniref:uncharacterized protein LOC120347650 isoform X2 n=1 Tax=Styela clava TaxID=7725 RepID=UPI00193A0479|nr:uncharacterized protein LOC120347650 isoform X2 [Styela clava]